MDNEKKKPLTKLKTYGYNRKHLIVESHVHEELKALSEYINIPLIKLITLMLEYHGYISKDKENAFFNMNEIEKGLKKFLALKKENKKDA